MAEFHQKHCEILTVGDRTREWFVSAGDVVGLKAHQIRYCGITHAREGFHFERPRAEIRQILACCGGVGEVWIHHRWRKCGKGMAYLTPVGARHRMQVKNIAEHLGYTDSVAFSTAFRRVMGRSPTEQRRGDY